MKLLEGLNEIPRLSLSFLSSVFYLLFYFFLLLFIYSNPQRLKPWSTYLIIDNHLRIVLHKGGKEKFLSILFLSFILLFLLSFIYSNSERLKFWPTYLIIDNHPRVVLHKGGKEKLGHKCLPSLSNTNYTCWTLN